jgi:hypothetical protein
MKKVLTAHQIHLNQMIPWVKSYKAVLNYISNDYKHILKPITKGTESGTRYFVPEKNIKRFVHMWETNKLSQ